MAGVPFERAGIAAWPSRAMWDAAALGLVGDMLERWNLTAGEVFDVGFAASVLRVAQADGSPAVLKVGYPHVESQYEAVALDAYGPGLAPALLRQDAWTWSMLLEPVEPGTSLASSALPTDAAIAEACAVHARVVACRVPPGIPRLDDQLGMFAGQARDRLRGDRSSLDGMGGATLVERALDDLEALLADDVPEGFLHGDFNPGNLLRATGGWRVIDPNPLVGDPAFDLWPLLTQVGDPLGARGATERGGLAVDVAALEHAVALAASLTGYNARRITRWAFARTGLNLSWYLQDGEEKLAALELEALDAWRRLAGY